MGRWFKHPRRETEFMHFEASFYTALNETGRLAEACSDDESEEEFY